MSGYRVSLAPFMPNVEPIFLSEPKLYLAGQLDAVVVCKEAAAGPPKDFKVRRSHVLQVLHG